MLVCVLSACGPASHGLEPGKATMPQLLDQMGEPSMVWSEGDGSLQLEFARIPKGGGNFMARVAPNGILMSLQQVLTEANVEALQPGMSRDQVRRALGRPGWIEGRESGELWHWPLDQNRPEVWQVDAQFSVAGTLLEVRRSRILYGQTLGGAAATGQQKRPQL
ncbi:hypothetical protein GCM10027046_02730 [Uliginosibacterium flavum]